MKQVNIKLVLALLMSMAGLSASAHDIEVKNAQDVTIYYNYINNGTELEVTFKGNAVLTYGNEYTGNVIIPEEVTFMNKTRKVTGIGTGAFFYCSNLTSVSIPNSVTSIGNDAFYYCTNLTSITIPSSIKSIGSGAFQECSGLKKVIASDISAWCGISFGNYLANPLSVCRHIYSDESNEITYLVIPDGVTSIGNYAFFGGISITSIAIPNSVTSIGESAFVYCSGLTSVTIGNSVTSIGESAFYGCSGLTSVTIPNSVTSIGVQAFSDCSGLTSVTIGSGVTSIGDKAFYGVDLPTVISLIENPSAINGKTSLLRTFSLNTFNNATLYVPKGTIGKYKATDGWKDFLFIEESAPTAIQTVKQDVATSDRSATIYNVKGELQTAPLEALPHGIYIVNGKTVVK